MRLFFNIILSVTTGLPAKMHVPWPFSGGFSGHCALPILDVVIQLRTRVPSQGVWLVFSFVLEENEIFSSTFFRYMHQVSFHFPAPICSIRDLRLQYSEVLFDSLRWSKPVRGWRHLAPNSYIGSGSNSFFWKFVLLALSLSLALLGMW